MLYLFIIVLYCALACVTAGIADSITEGEMWWQIVFPCGVFWPLVWGLLAVGLLMGLILMVGIGLYDLGRKL